MRSLTLCVAFFAGLLPTVASAQGKQVDRKCVLRVVRRSDIHLKEIQLHPGEKIPPNPLVAFEVLESGNVINARVERSSGKREIDTYALDWVRSARYNQRPGCGVIEGKASVTIDFR
jgi:TonB family protein